MIELTVYNLDGKPTGTMALDEKFLGSRVRPTLLKQAYVMYHANRRQGSAATRNRSRVEGSTRKLYKQKGTGNARRGAIRTNIMRGGGVAFGKRPRSWRQEMPIKMRRLATRNALLAKAVDGEIKVVEQFGFEGPKTQRFVTLLGALGIDRTCLLALEPSDRNVALSAHNVKQVRTVPIEQINVYEMLSRRYLLVARQALQGWLEHQKALPIGKAVDKPLQPEEAA